VLATSIGIDVAGAALALFVLLPPIHTGFIAFLAVYTIALSLGVIGHTPGGLGVFETAMVFALGGTVPPEAAVAALLTYRAIYFILPLLLSGALLAHSRSGRLPSVWRLAASSCHPRGSLSSCRCFWASSPLRLA
jgi:uncharacterized membrane protein YbhN (UPF0104 family)